MKTQDRRWWLFALPVMAVSACGERPTEPEVAGPDPVAAFAKPVRPPPSADIPLEVNIADEPNGVGSDGLGAYVDVEVGGDNFVSAVIRDNGMFYFRTFAGKKRAKPIVEREVWVDLSSQVGIAGSPSDLQEFQHDVALAGDTWPNLTSDVTLHTRNTDGGMYTMGPTTTLVDAGKIVFKDYGDGDSWEWRLLFGARVENEDGGVDHYEYGLCVKRPTLTTWEVTTDGAACGSDFNGIAQLWRVVRGKFTHVADFDTPMQMNLKTPSK